MRGKESHGALNLRPPDKTKRAPRRWQRTGTNQVCNHAGRFEDCDASAAVVVRPWALVVEMAAVDDLFGRGVGRDRAGARDDRGDDSPVTGFDYGLNVRIQQYKFPRLKLRPQCFCGRRRNHEGKARWLARIEMAPPNQSFIEPGPCGHLIRHVADNSRRAMLDDGHLLHAGQDPVGQNDLSTNILTLVVRFASTVSNVNQFSFDVGAVAIVGKSDRISRPTTD